MPLGQPGVVRGTLRMNRKMETPNGLVSMNARMKLAGTQSKLPVQPKRAHFSEARARHRVSSQPAAPAFPKIVQPKMHNPGPAAQSRSVGCSVSGVVQANVVGGNHALQARLSLWNTRLTRGASQTVGRSGDSISGQAAGASAARAIQRKTGPGVEAFRVPLRQKSGGMPIPDDVRAKMETAFGTDFSDVRVHIGQEAASLGAIAYTWGSNIHFAPGQYNPYTLQGQKLLGHELWHVVQQKSGRVKNPFGGGVAVVQDHALEAEADRMGIKAALTQIARRRQE